MNSKKKTAALLCGLICASVLAGRAGIMALAADNNGNEDTMSVPITKTLTKKANAPIPNTPIHFTVEPATEQEIQDSGNPTVGGYTVLPGIGEGKVFDTTYTINAPDEKDSMANAMNQTSYTYPALPLKPKLQAGSDVSSIFPKAGIYRYVVKEAAPSFPGLSAVNPDLYYYIDVFVENSSGTGQPERQIREILAWSINKLGGQGTTEQDFKTAEFKFANEYKTQTVTVSKTIAGNTADLKDTFQFKVTIDADNPDDVFTLIDAGGEAKFIRNTNGQFTAETTLGQNQSFSIDGLSANDTYTIQEEPGAYQVQINPNNDSTIQTDTASASASGKTGDTDHQISFVNTRTGNVPTGFFVTFGPYLIGLAAFGVLGYAMFHKKKAE